MQALDDAKIAVLIDVDGTLVDSTYLHAVAWASALRAHRIDVPTARVHRLIGMRGDRLLTELLGAERASAVGEAVQQEHTRRFLAVRAQVAPLPGARRLLDQLSDRGLPVVLTSSAQVEEIEHYLRLLGARHLVSGWTSASDVARSKPDPEPITAALARSGRDHGMVVGDSTWDCRAATAAGLPSIAVLTGGFAAAELTGAGAAIVCDDLDHICDQLDAIVTRCHALAAPAGRG
jgi:HAD superfamily hydrolase (TIGR01549 family)